MGHDFSIRFREHCNKDNTAMGCHLNNKKYKLDTIEKSLKILHVEPTGLDLDILENIRIYKCCNENPDTNLNEYICSHRKWFFDIFQDLF